MESLRGTTAGNYSVTKRFRNLEYNRKKKDMPWSKRILDLDNNKLFGRTAWGWSRIIFFYLLLYLIIAVILAVMTLIFIYTMHQENWPMWLKRQPGFSRMPNERTISYKKNIPIEIYRIADKIDNFLETFSKSRIDQFQELNKDKLWGYRDGNPTIFIKLNFILGFKPKTYDKVKDLPRNSPPELKRAVKQSTGGKFIWITCTISPEAIFKFVPGPYFNVTNGIDEKNRVVGVQILGLEYNKEADYACKMWAKNINTDMKYTGCGNVRGFINIYT